MCLGVCVCVCVCVCVFMCTRQCFSCFAECACFLWLSTAILRLNESVDFLSFLDMYLPVFLVLLVCVCVFLCHGVHRQTNRHSREISETEPANICARTHMKRTLAHA